MSDERAREVLNKLGNLLNEDLTPFGEQAVVAIIAAYGREQYDLAREEMRSESIHCECWQCLAQIRREKGD